MNTNIWERLQNIDRRIIYAILIAVILIPLFVPNLTLPTYPSKQSTDFYNTIERVAKESPQKIVIVDGQWSPSTRGENQWQAEAVVTHLMKRHMHFAILSFDTQNNTVMQTLVVAPLAKKYSYVYGRDYINWGYRPASVFVPTVKSLVVDIPGTIKKDYKGTPVTDFPVMKGIKSRADVGAVVEVTPTASADVWLGLFEQNNTPPFLFAPTAVMAPTYYPYIDTGQIAGMLTGIKGAGDYEGLLKTHSFGTRAAGTLSLVYGLIILLIIIGNVGFYASRAASRREGRQS
ncbi:MAG: hypothetical protein ACRYFS_24985 [Janthinobacterium lividum]